jgi:hypothetical protein
MKIATRVRKWTARTKHAVWAFLFLTSYAVSMIAPFMPAHASAGQSQSPTPASNPALTQACGLDIALVIDNSTSIDSTEMGQMKTALTSFTNALAGTPTEFSVTRFATSAQVIQPFTSDVSAVNTAINNVPVGGGYTNWEDAFTKAGSTLPNRSNPNLVIFATDGDPTTSTTVGGTDLSQPNAHLNPAITAANAIKNSGTRILMLGIGLGGDSHSVSRLEQVSGSNADTGSVLTSDVITTNFSTLANDLATFAEQTCGGTITTQKLIDADGNLQTTNDQSPASGWTFDVGGGSNPDATSTDSNGLTPAVKVTTGSGYSVSETVKAGYSVLSASCTGATSNGTWSSGNTVTGIQVSANNIIRCTFINKADTGTVVLKKVVDNTNGGTLGVNDFGLTIGGKTVKSGEELVVPVGTPVVINEADVSGYQFVSITGDGCPTVLGGAVTVAKGQTITCTIKNASKPATLIVNKVINGGSKTYSDFKFKINGGSPITFSASGSNTQSLAAGTYSVEEVADNSYTTTYDNCTNLALNIGDKQTCTITNTIKPTSLILDKKVVDNYNVGLTKDAWTLYAIGSTSISGKGGVTSGSNFKSGTYLLGESGPSGWDASGWNCGNKQVTNNTVVVNAGESVKCTITNTSRPVTISGFKTLDNVDLSWVTAGSNPVEGWKIFIDSNNNGILDAGEQWTLTNALGYYSFTGLNANTTYNINEVIISGSGWVQKQAPSSINVSKSGGSSWGNNFKNQAQGTLTVIKNIDNGFGRVRHDVKGWTWNYTGLQAKDYGVEAGNQYIQTVPAGTYAVTENQQSDYHLKSVVCRRDDGTPWQKQIKDTTFVTVGLGQHITCEFTNERDTGTITVHKKIGDKVDPKGWTWWLGDKWKTNDMGDTEKVTSGFYWFGENQKQGYSFESLKCKVDGRYIWVNQDVTAKVYVGRDDHVECTFTNSRDTGTVTVVKDARPDSSQGFNFTIQPVGNGSDDSDNCDNLNEGDQRQENVQEVIVGNTYDHHDGHDQNDNSNPPVAFTLTDNGTNDGKNTRSTALPTGEYMISEASVDGWDLSDISCGEARVEIKNNKVYVYVTKGVHITCTFTNTQRAQLTIVKDARPDGSKSFSFTSTLPDSLGVDTSFSLTDDGTGTMNSKAFQNLLPGTYTITETAANAWRLDSIACTGTGVTMVRDGYKLTVTLAAGAVASCTFVNTFVPQVLGETTLVNTGTDTIIAATIALTLTAAAIIVTMQRRKAYVTVRKD